ncbi:unnamed protein product [Larinioides sclopetarius]|uniref:Ribosomal protein L22 n=1 Tax=Larinioides sclopetarius TaxID=280406 RepID=A0AAV1ZTS8_9ARAC
MVCIKVVENDAKWRRKNWKKAKILVEKAQTSSPCLKIQKFSILKGILKTYIVPNVYRNKILLQLSTYD